MEVLNGRGNNIEVHLKNVVLTVSGIFIPTCNCKSSLSAERILETQSRSWVRFRVSIFLNYNPIIEALIEFKAMLNGSNFMYGNKVLDDHIDKFKFPNNRTIFFLKLFSLLNHKFLNIVICFIGKLQFIVYLSQLFAAMFNLLL